jgi:hypothetical protein
LKRDERQRSCETDTLEWSHGGSRCRWFHNRSAHGNSTSAGSLAGVAALWRQQCSNGEVLICSRSSFLVSSTDQEPRASPEGVYSVHNHEGRDHCNEGQVDGQKDKRAQEQRRHHETRQQSANQSLSPFCFFVQLSA